MHKRMRGVRFQRVRGCRYSMRKLIVSIIYFSIHPIEDASELNFWNSATCNVAHHAGFWFQRIDNLEVKTLTWVTLGIFQTQSR